MDNLGISINPGPGMDLQPISLDKGSAESARPGEFARTFEMTMDESTRSEARTAARTETRTAGKVGSEEPTANQPDTAADKAGRSVRAETETKGASASDNRSAGRAAESGQEAAHAGQDDVRQDGALRKSAKTDPRSSRNLAAAAADPRPGKLSVDGKVDGKKVGKKAQGGKTDSEEAMLKAAFESEEAAAALASKEAMASREGQPLTADKDGKIRGVDSKRPADGEQSLARNASAGETDALSMAETEEAAIESGTAAEAAVKAGKKAAIRVPASDDASGTVSGTDDASDVVDSTVTMMRRGSANVRGADTRSTAGDSGTESNDGRIRVIDFRSAAEKASEGASAQSGTETTREIVIDAETGAENAAAEEEGLPTLNAAFKEGASAERTANTGRPGAAMLANQLKDSANSEIVRQSQVILKDADSGEIRLILKPESLGKVRIRLNMQDNHIEGRIFVENNNVRDVFQNNLQELSRLFRENGFEMGSLDVFVGDRENSGQNDEPTKPNGYQLEALDSAPLPADGWAGNEQLVNLVV